MTTTKREKILVTVKTYPAVSGKYGELVCTAGIREDGSWIRIYPIPFTRLEEYYKFRKYQWIELDIVQRSQTEADKRPESYSPTNLSNMNILETVGTDSSWWERKRLILDKCFCFENLQELINLAKQNLLSLALFKPARITGFIHEYIGEDWNEDEKNRIHKFHSQLQLFDEVNSNYSLVSHKLPYKFSYRFQDVDGKESTLMISDWEIGMLYWSCYKKCQDQKIACEKVKEKYFENFLKKNDIYFFLGTTSSFHFRAPNPFIIIGVFYPPKTNQLELEL